LPEYANPPVNEVVCGILFKPLDSMMTPHIGLLWEHFRVDYPTCQEAPPIIPIIETFGERKPDPKPEFADIPPLPRVWYVHKDGNGVIQIQKDRFLHNWRKLNSQNRYPRFEQVFGMFLKHLETFESFVDENKLGPLLQLQYELTYVNHVHQGDGWETHADLGKVFADFAWRAKDRFLPPPESINWRTSFLLPDNCGRLHMTVRDGVDRENGRSLYVFELNARGFIGTGSPENLNNWFHLAHEWIVRGFTDLTDEDTQRNFWERTR
jgi:uncharacterized protein (TIGR04255 family)